MMRTLASAPSSAPPLIRPETLDSKVSKQTSKSSVSTDDTSRAARASPLINLLTLGLGFCCLLSVAMNFLHHDTFVHHSPDTAIARAMAEFKNHHRKPKRITQEDILEEQLIQNQGRDEREQQNQDDIEVVDVNDIRQNTGILAGLSCNDFGGPTETDHMVYWRNIPADETFVSPFRSEGRRQYLTFEPDGGGWNNIRMAMETIVALAIAMGRTLVLPPAQGMYLLMKDKKKQATDFTFANFFPMMKMAQENSALEVITMEEFLLLEAMTGNLVDKNTGLPSFPPDNRTDWDGHDVKVLKEWLRNVTYIEHFWKPGSCLAAFPATGNPKDVAHLKEWMQQLQSLMSKDDAFKFRGNPVPVDGPAKDRLHEALASRRELCVYDDFMQNQLVVHFMCYHKMRIRYLVHFYAFLFFENWKHDLWLKRFLRDHMRYVDEIQCAAARIVAELRQRALASSSSPNFDTMHIRRGDFQFKDTRISAEEILANSADVLTINKTLFVATDERDKTFFRPIQAAGYKLYFLDDFRDLLQGVNTNYYGMIDQLIASQGEIFLGCWHSTFTGYIMRLRGYHSTKRNLEGNMEGILPTSYYYVTLKNKFVMHRYEPLSGAFFNREFPTSWRQIDADVDMSATLEEEIMKKPEEEGDEGDYDGQLDGQSLEEEENEREGKISDVEKMEDEDEEENNEENLLEESVQ